VRPHLTDQQEAGQRIPLAKMPDFQHLTPAGSEKQKAPSDFRKLMILALVRAGSAPRSVDSGRSAARQRQQL
jgi:hypothetical protein